MTIMSDGAIPKPPIWNGGYAAADAAANWCCFRATIYSWAILLKGLTCARQDVIEDKLSSILATVLDQPALGSRVLQFIE